MAAKTSVFSKSLLQWHSEIDRQLPWKKTKDPYKIWISEIVLQQTRVAQGTAYYERLITSFPTVKHLAQAQEDEVLTNWKGLGYYARARNMHAAAKQIMTTFNGKFPSDYKDILSLKGVGPYTAAAIASFAFDLPYAVLDGNVFRVLSRYLNESTPIDSTLGKKFFTNKAEELLDKKQPAAYNQAIMDFGALHCMPKNPSCHNCPFESSCAGLLNGTVGLLPIKAKKLKVKKRFFHYYLLTYKNRIYLEKRAEEDIWKGLYQPFLIESEKALTRQKVIQQLTDELNLSSDQIGRINQVGEDKQRLTHQLIQGIFYQIELSDVELTSFWKSHEELKNLATPKLIDSFFSRYLRDYD